MQEYDAVIIGAGPAGLTTAKFAAEKGIRVLILERKQQIGIPVHCGEFLPTVPETKKLIPEASEVEISFQVSKKAIANKTSYVRMIYPNGQEIETKFEGIVLERRIFDRDLANKAIKVGADIQVQTKALGLSKEGIIALVGSKYVKIQASVVVGANGSISKVAQWLGLPRISNPMDLGIGLQAEMARVETDEDTIEMYFGKNYAPGAYAWIIPKGEGIANVGISLRSPFMQKGTTIRDYLHRFIRKHPIASKKLRKATLLAIKAGTVPVGGPIRKTYVQNALIVGDAAGQSIPTVGAGIPPALICGRIAGKAIADYIKNRKPLSVYEKEWRKEVGPVLKRALKLRKIGDIFFKSDKLTSFLSEKGWLNEEMVKRFIYCQIDARMLLIGRVMARFLRKFVS